MQPTDYNQPTPLVSQTLAGVKPGHVLDIGSHQGRNSLYLARLGWKVTAIDMDQKALTHLQEAANKEGLSVQTILTDVRDYNPKARFDAILALMILHFLPENKIDPVINNMQKWTNKDGINIVTSFTTENPADTRPYLFPTDSLRKKYGGWAIESYEEGYTSWIIPDGKLKAERYMAARLVAKKQNQYLQ